jgi:extradiol dioxygenase family protein
MSHPYRVAQRGLKALGYSTLGEGEHTLRRSGARALADRLRAAGTSFIIEPHVRFQGEVGEQATMFFLDPSGNALEFKSFADMGQVFAK